MAASDDFMPAAHVSNSVTQATTRMDADWAKFVALVRFY
jgi:hypothetical protein